MLSTLVMSHPWGPPFVGGLGVFFLLIPLFWIGVIVLIATLGRRRWRRTWSEQGGHPAFGGWAAGRGAESTLAERFAQGDIDEVEYRARLEVLRANAYPQQH